MMASPSFLLLKFAPMSASPSRSSSRLPSFVLPDPLWLFTVSLGKNLWPKASCDLLPSSISRPDLHRLIKACRSNAFTIRRPGGTIDSVSMPFVGQKQPPALHLPHLHRLIKACRSDACAIGRPGYAPDSVSMPVVGQKQLSAVCRPHL